MWTDRQRSALAKAHYTIHHGSAKDAARFLSNINDVKNTSTAMLNKLKRMCLLTNNTNATSPTPNNTAALSTGAPTFKPNASGATMACATRSWAEDAARNAADSDGDTVSVDDDSTESDGMDEASNNVNTRAAWSYEKWKRAFAKSNGAPEPAGIRCVDAEPYE